MKKIIVLVFTFFYVLCTFSQEESGGKEINKIKNYDISVKLGAIGSYFNTEISQCPNNGFDSFFRLGVTFGAQLNYYFSEDLFVSGGLQLNSRGGQYRQKNSSVVVFSDRGVQNAYNRKVFVLNYFEIPFTIGYNVRKTSYKYDSEKKSPVFVSIGLIPAFNFGSTFKQNSFTGSRGSGLVDANESFDSTPFNYANSFLLSGQVSVNFVIHQSKLGDFFNEISLSQSFGDVYNIDELNSNNFMTKIGALSFAVGYRFK